MKFTQNLIRLREAAQLTQSDLARLVGVRPQSVQQWETSGGTAPSRRNQDKVAEALGVTKSELMFGNAAELELSSVLTEARAMLGELSDDNLAIMHSALTGILFSNKK